MLKRIVYFGIIAGVILGTPLFAMTVTHTGPAIGLLGMVIGYLTMLVALSTIFLAIKQQRDEAGGGVIRFWPAFALGLGITAVAGLFYVAAWEAAQAIVHEDFAAAYARATIANAEAAGTRGAALARVEADMATFRRNYADPLFRLPMTFAEIFPVGVLVSLVSAALLRNSRLLPAAAGQRIA